MLWELFGSGEVGVTSQNGLLDFDESLGRLFCRIMCTDGSSTVRAGTYIKKVLRVDFMLSWFEAEVFRFDSNCEKS